MLHAAALIAVAAAASPISQLNLSPVYGSIPASQFHQSAVITTIALAFVTTLASRKHAHASYGRYVPVVAFWTQPIQYVLFQYSSHMGPVYGPLTTEALTYLPLLFLAVCSASMYFSELDFSSVNSLIARSACAVAGYIAFASVRRSTNAVLPQLMGTTNFLTRSGLQLAVAIAFSVLSPSMHVLLAIPALMHTLLLNPQNPAAMTTMLLKGTL